MIEVKATKGLGGLYDHVKLEISKDEETGAIHVGAKKFLDAAQKKLLRQDSFVARPDGYIAGYSEEGFRDGGFEVRKADVYTQLDKLCTRLQKNYDPYEEKQKTHVKKTILEIDTLLTGLFSRHYRPAASDKSSSAMSR